MLKMLMASVAVAALTMAITPSDARAGGGGVISVQFFDIPEIAESDGDDDGPDCEWIERQVRDVGSAYWKTRYYEECVSTVEADD